MRQPFAGFAERFRQQARKSYWRDRQIFNRAVSLAAALEENGITHVHCPWLTDNALVALLAARLLKIQHTVQARASDIRRHTAVHGRLEKLAHAAFVVTNTRYNEALLRSWLPNGSAAKIHVILTGGDRFHRRTRLRNHFLTDF